MPRIYTPQALDPGATLRLEEGAARHVAGALRLKRGDEITLFNGSGGEYRASLSSVERKAVEAEVLDYIERSSESPLPIRLGIAMSRGERMDWVIQKSTELGVTEIFPLVTERTEVRLRGEREAKKIIHWEKIAVSACEQCGRNTLPLIHAPSAVGGWTRDIEADCKLVLHHRSAQGLAELTRPATLALLVGPEGGLSASEIELAEASGFRSLALGPRVLRTETAPLAAVAILQHHWGDMK